MNTVTVDLKELSTFDDWIQSANNKTVQFADDPVAMACAAQREANQRGGMYGDLDSAVIQTEDRVKAESVRKFYLDQLMFQVLRGGQISEFRRKLYGVLNGTLALTQKDIGLLYKLPYFYDEDQDILTVCDTYQSAPNRHLTKTVMTVVPQLRSNCRRRSANSTIFWWTNADNHAIAWKVDQKNDLFTLVESVWESRQKINLQANYMVRGFKLQPTFAYYNIYQPRIVP